MKKGIHSALKQQKKMAPDTFYIQVKPDGPYLVYGKPPVDQEIIVPNEEGTSWLYRKGKHYDTTDSPIALCRCGNSKRAPFCDGAHSHTDWDPRETADKRSILEEVEVFEGPVYTLIDSERYCAFARFCDAYGRVWNIVRHARTESEKELARHEVEHCPAGRLMLYENETGRFYEPELEPSIGLIEDPGMRVSGPIWVKGGIRIESADGSNYEIRNRVTLCRCGQSYNKPFCDGTHASVHYHDHIDEK